MTSRMSNKKILWFWELKPILSCPVSEWSFKKLMRLHSPGLSRIQMEEYVNELIESLDQNKQWQDFLIANKTRLIDGMAQVHVLNG